MNGHLEVVKELIAKKANINQANSDGGTAFILAAWCGKLNVVKELLNSGSDLLLVNTYEDLILHKLLSDVEVRVSFDKLPQGNFEGLNSLAKLQLLRAFKFMENNYDKFKKFYTIEHIQKVKASLEVFKPLEAFINELTDTNVLDFSTAESRHKLENSINHLKHILENKAKYESEGIAVNQSKIKEFQNKCKVAIDSKYYEFTQNVGNIGLRFFSKQFEDTGHMGLPKYIWAEIFEEVLITNREAKDNYDASVVEKKLPCATDMLLDINSLNNHIAELGAVLKLFE